MYSPSFVTGVTIAAGVDAQSATIDLETLAQDCIAVYDPRTKRGRLIGPRASAWGEFTPEYFVLPTGERLA